MPAAVPLVIVPIVPPLVFPAAPPLKAMLVAGFAIVAAPATWAPHLPAVQLAAVVIGMNVAEAEVAVKLFILLAVRFMGAGIALVARALTS